MSIVLDSNAWSDLFAAITPWSWGYLGIGIGLGTSIIGAAW